MFGVRDEPRTRPPHGVGPGRSPSSWEAYPSFRRRLSWRAPNSALQVLRFESPRGLLASPAKEGRTAATAAIGPVSLILPHLYTQRPASRFTEKAKILRRVLTTRKQKPEGQRMHRQLQASPALQSAKPDFVATNPLRRTEISAVRRKLQNTRQQGHSRSLVVVHWSIRTNQRIEASRLAGSLLTNDFALERGPW